MAPNLLAQADRRKVTQVTQVQVAQVGSIKLNMKYKIGNSQRPLAIWEGNALSGSKDKLKKKKQQKKRIY